MPARCRALILCALGALLGACGGGDPLLGRLRAAAGQGVDGDLEVTERLTLNRYAALALDAKRGDRQLALSASAGVGKLQPLLTGDVVLIIQMQGALISTENSLSFGQVGDLAGAGNYEFIGVSDVDPERNVITVLDACGGLRNNYSAAGQTQIIRVPQFGRLSVAGGGAVVAPPWDGRLGGVVALMAQGTIQVEGAIDASAAGFRGAPRNENGMRRVQGNSDFYTSIGKQDGGVKGEGVAGSAQQLLAAGSYGRGAPGNGGGGGNRQMSGGGGGGGAGDPTRWRGNGVMPEIAGSAGCGPNAGWLLDPEVTSSQLSRESGGGRGGYSYSAPDKVLSPCMVGPNDTDWGGDFRLQRGGLGGRPLQPRVGTSLFFGGGGGGGDEYQSSGGVGGSGGGIVLLLAGGVRGGGAVRANGGPGGDSQVGGTAGAGGGGGGGAVIIASQAYSDVRLEAAGGVGGTQRGNGNEGGGPGGGGGGGYIAAPDSGVRGPIVASGGRAGTTTVPGLASFPYNGATSGGEGDIDLLPANRADQQPICSSADLQLTVTPPPSLNGQKAAAVALSVRNNGPSPSSKISLKVSLPEGTTVAGFDGMGWMCQKADPGVVCSLDRLALEGTSSVLIRLVPPLGAAAITMQAELGGSPMDPDLSNNVREVTIGVSGVLIESAVGGGVSCAVARGGGAAADLGAALPLLALILCCAAPRRRRGLPALRRRGVVLLLGAAALWLAPGAARAQSAGFSIERHEGTPPGSWFFLVEMPYFSRTRPFAAGISMSYAHNPLIYRLLTDEGVIVKSFPLISRRVQFSFDFVGTFFDRVQLALSLPILAPEDGTAQSGVTPLSSGSIGDPRLSMVVRLFGQPEYSRLTLSAGVTAYLPLRRLNGSLPQQIGDLDPHIFGRLIASGTAGLFHYSALLGFRYRGEAQMAGARVGSSAVLGFAAGFYNPNWHFSAGPELLFTTAVDGRALRPEGTSLEVLLGAQYNVLRQVQAGFALGVGALSEAGTPDLRILLRLAYAPLRPPDRDRDGVLDKEDACPDQPGQPSGVPSNHGCPPLSDRDCDGVPDGEDQCPDEPEDPRGGTELGCPRRSVTAPAAPPRRRR